MNRNLQRKNVDIGGGVTATSGGGTSFPEAPTDGEAYGRVNGEWGKVLKKPSVEVTEIPVTLTFDDSLGFYIGDKFIDTGEVIVNGERYSCPQGDYMGMPCYGNLYFIEGTGGEDIPFLYIDYSAAGYGIPMLVLCTIDIQSFAFVGETKKDPISAECVDGVIPYLKEGWIDAEIEYYGDGQGYRIYLCSFTELPTKVIVNGEEWELEKQLVASDMVAGNVNVVINPSFVQEGECPIVFIHHDLGGIKLNSLIEIDSLKVWGNTYANKITPEVVDDAVYKKAVEFDDKGLEALFNEWVNKGKFVTSSHEAAIDALFDANDISKDIENGFISPQLGTMTFTGPTRRMLCSVGNNLVVTFQVSGFNVASNLQYLRVAATNVVLGNQLEIVQNGDNAVSLATPQLNVPFGIYKVFIYDSRYPMLRSDVVTIEAFGGVLSPNVLCSKVVKRVEGREIYYYITAYTTFYYPSQINITWYNIGGSIPSASPAVKNTVAHAPIGNQYILRSTLRVIDYECGDTVRLVLQHYKSSPREFEIKVK